MLTQSYMMTHNKKSSQEKVKVATNQHMETYNKLMQIMQDKNQMIRMKSNEKKPVQ